jgi:hypothetical protein
MVVAGFLVNVFKDCGVDLCVALQDNTCTGEVPRSITGEVAGVKSIYWIARATALSSTLISTQCSLGQPVLDAVFDFICTDGPAATTKFSHAVKTVRSRQSLDERPAIIAPKVSCGRGRGMLVNV